jgi:hypothetical protein
MIISDIVISIVKLYSNMMMISYTCNNITIVNNTNDDNDDDMMMIMMMIYN